MILSGLSYDLSSAISAEPTPEDYWPQNLPLVISAYQRNDAPGNDLVMLEVFNNSESLIDLGDWTITGGYESGQGFTNELLVTRRDGFLGKMAPNTHATIELAGGVEVSNSSYVSTGWSTPKPFSVGRLVSLTVKSKSSGYKTDVYSLKTTGTSGAYVYNDFWRRTALTTPSYSATLSAFNVATPQVYDDGLYLAPNSTTVQVDEIYPYASDCTPDDKNPLCGDYIKLYVGSLEAENLVDFVVRTGSSLSSRTSSNTFYLADYEPQNGYITIMTNADGEKVSLTNSGGYVWLEDVYEGQIYSNTMTEYQSATSNYQGWSLARDDNNLWQWTLTPQPGAPNRISLLEVTGDTTACPAGKYLNPETGRCRTIEEAVNALSACAEGEYRNPTTNRCRKIVAAGDSLVSCGEGQERNPLTNRCRSIASAVAELLPCDEGYERNPATNRCRKVMGTAIGAGKPVAQSAKMPDSDPTMNAWGWALVAVAVSGVVGYGVYEWRNEVAGALRKVVARLGKK